MRKLLILMVSLFAATTALAEQKVVQNGYEIHYNAFNSDFISPEVAQANGLLRSKVRALVNVAVFELQADGSKRAVRARIDGTAANMLQQQQVLEFAPIQEQNALYYIGGFRFTNDERITIKLSIQPNPDRAPIEIDFAQKFYTEQ